MGRTIGNPCLLFSDCKESPWHVGQVSFSVIVREGQVGLQVLWTEGGSMVFIRDVLKDVVGILSFQKAWTAFMCHNSAKLLKAQIHFTVTEEAPVIFLVAQAFSLVLLAKRGALMLVCKISQNNNFWGFSL